MVTDGERQAFSARLNGCLDELDVPPKGQGRQGAVAKMFGVTQKGARKWLEGEAIPTTKRLSPMAQRLGVTFEWLMTGQGPKHPGEGAGAQPAPDTTDDSLAGLLQRLATRLEAADPAVRHEVMGLVMRYMDNPEAGAKIAAAIELLVSKDAPDDPAP